MFPILPPEPDPGNLLCPSCGTPRITSAAETCYQCGNKLPRYPGRLPGKAEPENFPLATNPLWVVMGMFYLCCVGISLMLVARAPGALIILTIMAMPPLFRTIHRSNRQVEAGKPFTAQEWYVVFVGSLGMMAVASLSLFCVLAIAAAFLSSFFHVRVRE